MSSVNKIMEINAVNFPEDQTTRKTFEQSLEQPSKIGISKNGKE